MRVNDLSEEWVIVLFLFFILTLLSNHHLSHPWPPLSHSLLLSLSHSLSLSFSLSLSHTLSVTSSLSLSLSLSFSLARAFSSSLSLALSLSLTPDCSPRRLGDFERHQLQLLESKIRVPPLLYYETSSSILAPLLRSLVPFFILSCSLKLSPCNPPHRSFALKHFPLLHFSTSFLLLSYIAT
jgi:hypothetical protein